MLEEPQIVETTARPVAAIRLTVPRDEIREVMGPGHRELMDAVAAQGAGPAGAWLTHHFQRPSESFDFAICVPVSKPISPVGRVKPSELPAATVVRTIYRGPYEGLAKAWGEFETWIAKRGYKTAPNLWEVYVAGPESSPDPASFRTELNQPLI